MAAPRETAIRLALTALVAGLAAPRAATADPAVIRSVRPVGAYVEVNLRKQSRLTGASDRAVLLPATPVCLRLARPEASIEWVERGFPGRVEAEGESCEAAGILDLEAWRDRLPRPEVRFAPRATARWTLVHRDGRRATLRGRFPLANLVGMSLTADLVAVVADDASCLGVIAGNEGSIEYRASGRVAYRLTAGGSPCHVLGFARPVEAATSFAPGAAPDPGEPRAQSW